MKCLNSSFLLSPFISNNHVFGVIFMKKIIFLLSLCLFTTASHAETEVVPLDMEFGYWESKTEIQANEMIDKMLAGIPEAQRAQMMAMVKSQLNQSKVSKQCFSEETFKNFEEEFKKSMGGKQDCSFKVQKSTKTELVGEIYCPEGVIKINTKLINKKETKSSITTSGEMGGMNMNMTSKFVSSQCPAGG